MKKYIVFLLPLILNLTILNANEYIKINLELLCTDPVKNIFTIKVNSNKLNLTEDAVQDNVGGYVDIAEDKHYLKTDDKLYYLDGIVEHNYNSNTNQFISYINNTSGKFITIEELYKLKNQKNLKFIQKIILSNNNTNNRYKITTNILYVYFDNKLFINEYEKCQK